MSDNHPPTRGRNTYIGKSDPAEFPDRYSLFELRPDGSGTYVELSQNEDADSAEDIVQETCFVLMPFRDPFVGYYEDIYVQAIKASGLQPVQAGEITKPGAISNQIWQGINNASVCLAELTGQNPNVMYELGLAHAVGKPVVSLVQSMDDIPFDLRHLRHIVYDTSAVRWDEALRTKIEAMLQATIADPHQSLAFPDIGTSQPRRRPPAITAIGQAPSVPLQRTNPSTNVLTPSGDTASLINDFVEHMVTQEHMEIRTAGITMKDVIVAFIDRTNVMVTLVHNGTQRPVRFDSIQSVSPLDQQQPRNELEQRWIREFARYLITQQELEIITTDEVVERAAVHQIGVGSAALQSLDGNIFISVVYPEIVSVNPR